MAGKKQPPPTKPAKGGAGKRPRDQKPVQPIAENQESEEEELRRQQTLLNIFSNTFRAVLEADDFASQLQEVKGALFNRDFAGAFAREAALDVYAARWSPTRALCYARVLRELDAHLRGLVGGTSSARVDRSHDSLETEIGTREVEDEHESAHGEQNESAEEKETSTIQAERGDTNTEESKTQPLRILAIGGAAAEIVAFADYISSHTSNSTSSTTAPIQGEITLLDIGPWGSMTSRLQTALTSTPPISRYASAAAKASNKALVDASQLKSTFIQQDILSATDTELASLLEGGGERGETENKKNNTPILITLLFTLNELYTAGGIKRTTSFLRLLSSSPSLAPGSLLLVVDSPGSYSEAAVGGGGGGGGDGQTKKRYPMQWLLEHTLIPPPSRRSPEKKKKNSGQAETKEEGEEDGREGKKEENEEEEEEGGSGIRWEKIESRDSVWFRVAEGLRYPIPLENMRYQMHLYRACRAS
ncbi:hypothetical protein F4859DRAFT_513428 [Xylaria cf. heliscus]|nr:hypothetical protein F4859DRAFT_513428 [Xylaria cf. heliscus]